MSILGNYLYEYKKGLRNLILHTMKAADESSAVRKLARHNIDYTVHRVSDEKINLFFGNPNCVEVIKRINKPRLEDLSDEEDFILGALLGYDIASQCQRHLVRNEREGNQPIDNIRGATCRVMQS
ncbi:MAG TPA: DUF2023 family protein [Spirochaetota bacterium]|nr:DUF2023 family protein [Spirochaetota bacterium]HNT11495.1 DUF2023 family protein [Spirochaetota bacterium]HPU88263.1 DUF2023 family protein [Spirochaetota bacterium]